jgi:hypothetical protein
MATIDEEIWEDVLALRTQISVNMTYAGLGRRYKRAAIRYRLNKLVKQGILEVQNIWDGANTKYYQLKDEVKK